MSEVAAFSLSLAEARDLTDEIKALMGPRRPRRPARRRDVSTDVYSFYDEAGCALYVGLSLSVVNRLAEHRQRGWWSQVSRIEVEHLASRDEASARECELIADLAPIHNRNRGGA